MDESVEWIMSTLYGNIPMTVDSHNSLKSDVIALVEKWEKILEKDKEEA